MLQANERLGDFQIIRPLGKGGMGEVYEARQLNPERRVALKVLAPWLADDDDSLRRFMKEAEVPANLDHPGIVRIISTGKTPDGVAFYAMQLVRGVSVAQMIKRSSSSPSSEVPTRTIESAATPSQAAGGQDGSPAPPSPMAPEDSVPPLAKEYRRDRFATLARIGLQVARALAFAHDQGFLHRDIKPSNLMVDFHDHVYLVDFGLTRGLAPAGDATQPGTIVGTPWYMSPEQADGRALDERSDIYSLGITLYEMATQGLGPFSGNRDDRNSVLTQVRAGKLLPLRTLAPGVPVELVKIIDKATAFRPENRHAGAAEIAKDLEEFLGIEGRRSADPLARPLPKSTTPRRWAIYACATLGVCALLAALAAYAMRDRDPMGPKTNNGAARKFDGTLALPEELRDQKTDLKIPLMKIHHEPLFKERWLGDGRYVPDQRKLILLAYKEGLVIYGLADPDRHNFDFSIEAGKLHSAVRDVTANRLGIVFGWRRRTAEADVHPRCFVVELDEHPKWLGGQGQLKIGTGWVVAPNADRGGIREWFTLLPDGKFLVPLEKSTPYHLIEVKVRRDRAEVSVDGGRPQVVSLAWLRDRDARAAEKLDPRGAIGIWALKGAGHFRNATITLLDE